MSEIKLLIADDEFVSRKTLKTFSEKLGYHVFEAENGQQAFDIWKKERPSFVVTDWEMPMMSGLELVQKIRENEGEDYTYIVMVTSKGESQDVIQGLHAGADEYLAKPFNKNELYARLQSGERILTLQSKDVVIFALAKLAESRDEDTGNHLERVRYYSKSLGLALLLGSNPPDGLDQSLVDGLYLTSPLHDIGKVGIPDYILLKPGRLDDKEFNIMKTHSYLGYKTLIDAAMKVQRGNFLKLAAEIAYHHHEKFDGSGYPNQQKGEEIHIASRIFALADVYDALVSKRPYKEPFTHARARAIITDGRGTHFDPRVVDAFLDIEQEFIDIAEKYKD